LRRRFFQQPPIRAKGGNAVIGYGQYTPHGKGMVSPAYNFGVQAVEVNIDTEIGKGDLIHITTAHECGKVINPIGLEGQVGGASVMAVGWALTEDLQTRNGKVINGNFRDLKLLHLRDWR
jgi:CO/xanthine dehydrogenase Mo-binding subunit